MEAPPHWARENKKEAKMLLTAIWVAVRSIAAATFLSFSTHGVESKTKRVVTKRYRLNLAQSWSHRFWFAYAIMLANDRRLLKIKRWRYEPFDRLLPVGTTGYSDLLSNLGVLTGSSRSRPYGPLALLQHLRQDPWSLFRVHPKPLAGKKLKSALRQLPWTVSDGPRSHYLHFVDPQTKEELHVKVHHYEYATGPGLSLEIDSPSIVEPVAESGVPVGDTDDLAELFVGTYDDDSQELDPLDWAEAIGFARDGAYNEPDFAKRALERKNAIRRALKSGTVLVRP